MILLEIEIMDLALFELFSDLLILLCHISVSVYCLSVAYKYSAKVITHNVHYPQHVHYTQHDILNWKHQEDVAGMSANISL